MGIDEKSRLRATVIQARHEREEKESDQVKAKDEKLKRDAMLSVDFDFGEIDFDTFLSKFIMKCHTFETRELGPLGWSSFTADALNFHDFKNVLRKQFDLKLTPAQLGALIVYCYPIGRVKNLMSCRIFINTFLHNKLSTEKYKGSRNETANLKLYISQLKDAHLNKYKRIRAFPDSVPNTAEKPWRM